MLIWFVCVFRSGQIAGAAVRVCGQQRGPERSPLLLVQQGHRLQRVIQPLTQLLTQRTAVETKHYMLCKISFISLCAAAAQVRCVVSGDGRLPGRGSR